MKKSAFLSWFRLQFGPREKMRATDEELKLDIIAGLRSKVELDRREEWDRQRDTALKGWAASNTGERR